MQLMYYYVYSEITTYYKLTSVYRRDGQVENLKSFVSQLLHNVCMLLACLIISHDDTISSTTADDYRTTPAVDKPITLTQAYLVRSDNPTA